MFRFLKISILFFKQISFSIFHFFILKIYLHNHIMHYACNRIRNRSLFVFVVSLYHSKFRIGTFRFPFSNLHSFVFRAISTPLPSHMNRTFLRVPLLTPSWRLQSLCSFIWIPTSLCRLVCVELWGIAFLFNRLLSRLPVFRELRRLRCTLFCTMMLVINSMILRWFYSKILRKSWKIYD